MDTRKDKIRETISDLKDNGFIQTLDRITTYSENADLYFMQVIGSENEFVVLNHYCKKCRVEFQGFDLWVSTFEKQEDIGRKPPISNQMIKRCFDIDRDLKLLLQTLKTSIGKK